MNIKLRLFHKNISIWEGCETNRIIKTNKAAAGIPVYVFVKEMLASIY